MAELTAAPPEPRSYRWVAAPLLAFAVFSLTAGLLAAHDPRSKGYFRLFFSDPLHLKAGFATAAVVLACFQLFTAAWIFRKLPWEKPAWVNPVHRWSGRLAFAFTLPVAYHCIFKLGFRSPTTRVLAHSLFGCAVYGAFAAKVTIVRLHRFPKPVLPIAGGLLFAVLIGVWYTSAVWLYSQNTAAAAPAKSSPIPAAANAAAGEEGLQDRRLRLVPHAEGRRSRRPDRAEPRHGSGPTSRPSARRSRRRRRDAVVQGPAERGSDPRRCGFCGEGSRLIERVKGLRHEASSPSPRPQTNR